MTTNSAQHPPPQPPPPLDTPFSTFDIQLLTAIRRTDRSECIDDVIQLLKVGANPNTFDINDGNSALMYACYSDQPDVVAALLLFGGGNGIFHTNYFGQNAFMWGAISGSIPSLRLLFDYIQHTPDLQTSKLFTPQQTSSPSSTTGTATITTQSGMTIITHLASLTHPTPSQLYNNDILSHIFASRCQSGLTMVHYATRFRRKATVLFLYYKGSLLNYIDTNGRNILHHACLLDIPHIAMWLIQYGLMDITQQDFNGDTPIHLVLQNQNTKLLSTLVKYCHASRAFGAVNHAGHSPHSIALASKNRKLISIVEDSTPTGFDFYKWYGFSVESGGAYLNRFFLALCCHFGLTYNLIVRYIRTNTGMVSIIKKTKNSNNSENNNNKMNANKQHTNNPQHDHEIHHNQDDPLILTSLESSDEHPLDTLITQPLPLSPRIKSQQYKSTTHPAPPSSLPIKTQHHPYTRAQVQEDFNSQLYTPNMDTIRKIDQLLLPPAMSDELQHSPRENKHPTLSPEQFEAIPRIIPMQQLSLRERATLWMTTTTGSSLPESPEFKTYNDGTDPNTISPIWSQLIKKHHHLQNSPPLFPPEQQQSNEKKQSVLTTLTTPLSASPNVLLPPLLDYLEAPTIFESPEDHHPDSSLGQIPEGNINTTPPLSLREQPLYFVRNTAHKLATGLDFFNNCYKSYCADWNDRQVPSFWAGRYLFAFITVAAFHLFTVIFPYQWKIFYKAHTTHTDEGDVLFYSTFDLVYLLGKQAFLCLLSLSILATWLVCHYSDPGIIQPAPAREIKHEAGYGNCSEFSHSSSDYQPQHSSKNNTGISSISTTNYFNSKLLSPFPTNDEFVYLYPSRAQQIQELATLQYTHSLMHQSMASGIGSLYIPSQKHKVCPIGRPYTDNRSSDGTENGFNYDNLSELGHFDPTEDLEAGSTYPHPSITTTPSLDLTQPPQVFYISPLGDRNVLQPLPLLQDDRVHPCDMYFPIAAQGIVQTARLFTPAITTTSTTSSFNIIPLTFTNGLSIETSENGSYDQLAVSHPDLLISTKTTDFNCYDSPNNQSHHNSTTLPITPQAIPSLSTISLYNTVIRPLTYLPQSIYSTTPIHLQQPHFLMPPLISTHNHSLPLPPLQQTQLPTQPHISGLSPTLLYPLDGYLIDPYSEVNTSKLFTRHWNFFHSSPIHAYFNRSFNLSSARYPEWFNVPLSYDPQTLNGTNYGIVNYLANSPATQLTPLFNQQTIFSITPTSSNNHHRSNKSFTASTLTSQPYSPSIQLNEVSLLSSINIALGAMWHSVFHSKFALYVLPSWTNPWVSEDDITKSAYDPQTNPAYHDEQRKQHILTKKQIKSNFITMVENELIPTLHPEVFATNTDPLSSRFSTQPVDTTQPNIPQDLTDIITNNTVSPDGELVPTNTLLANPIGSHLPTPNDSPFFCASHFITLLTSGIVTTPNADGDNQFPINPKMYPHQADIVNQNNSNIICLDCRIATPVASYHCKTCQHCIYWLDHHCPLLDTCIGAGNYRSFVLFCALGTTMSIYYLITLILWLIGISLEAIGQSKHPYPETIIFNFIVYDPTNLFSVVLLFHTLLFTFFVSLLFLSHIALICGNESSVTSMGKSVVKYNPKVYSSRHSRTSPHSERPIELTSHGASNGIWYNSAGVIDSWKAFLIGRMNVPIEFPCFGQTLPPMTLLKRFKTKEGQHNNVNDQVAIAVGQNNYHTHTEGITPNRIYYRQDLLHLNTVAIPRNVNNLRKFIIKTLFSLDELKVDLS